MDIKNDWKEFLDKQKQRQYYKDLMSFLDREYKNKSIFPDRENIFRAFNLTPLSKIKVVIIGQDPYYKKGQAHGLAFSVNKKVKVPKSLRNIFKEIKSGYPDFNKEDGNLDMWADQGVFLINRVLTVEQGKPNSHKNKGWEEFTASAINYLNTEKEKIIFVLWGKDAQGFESIIDTSKHYVLKSSHPSPFAAHISFHGARHFNKINEILEANNKDTIDWSK